MKRSYSLQVERLEDRWVPSADPLLVVIDSPPADPTPPVVDESFVIDVYLVDPNAPTTPAKPVDQSIPDSSWSLPDQSIVPPIGDPFWAVSLEDAPADDGTSFVIDVYLIDPNAPTTPTKPVDQSIPDSSWGEPDQSIVPPIGDPFWAV